MEINIIQLNLVAYRHVTKREHSWPVVCSLDENDRIGSLNGFQWVHFVIATSLQVLQSLSDCDDVRISPSKRPLRS